MVTELALVQPVLAMEAAADIDYMAFEPGSASMLCMLALASAMLASSPATVP
jgi:hypothetical protein